MSSKKLLTLGVTCVLALTGCVTTSVSKKDMAEYQNAPLVDAEFMPSEEELNNDRVKIIVVEGDDNINAAARAADLGTVVSRAISGKVGQRGVEVIDSKLAPRLSDALRVAESKGSSTYTGPKAASYVLKPAISVANTSSSYSAPSQFKDKKGRVTTTPASYTFKGEVKAAVRVYSMPSLKLVTTIPIEGTAVSSGNANQLIPHNGIPLLQEAANSAVEENEHEIFNFFAGRGYVSAKRTNGKNSIFLVTIGTEDGIKTGDKVLFFSRRQTEDTGLRRKAGAASIEEIQVAEGTVTENVKPDEAWVAISSEESARKVMRGDVVKAEHSESFLNSLKKNVKKIM